MENYIGFDGVPLGFKEIVHPEDVTKFVIDSNQFSLGGALGVNALLSGRAADGPSAQGHDVASVAAAVIVGLVGTINVPENMSEGVNAEMEVETSGPIKVF